MQQRRKAIVSVCSDNLIFEIAAFTEINVEKDMQAQTETQCFSHGS